MRIVHHELCFGCGRANLFGLPLEVEETAPGSVFGQCFIKQDHQGAQPGCAHEGVVGAALSEAMALACGLGARPARLEVRFTAPSPVGVFLQIDAHVEARHEQLIDASASASCDQGAIAHEWGSGFIVAGHVKAVFAKSFARIHRRNLIAQGIVALTFADERNYDRAAVGQTWIRCGCFPGSGAS